MRYAPKKSLIRINTIPETHNEICNMITYTIMARIMMSNKHLFIKCSKMLNPFVLACILYYNMMIFIGEINKM